MSLHKLTAGTGYTYLTRQVAALDATERGHAGLADYYAQRGEAPGTWWGAGLAGLGDVPVGSPVGEEQMVALFGAGRHPNAARREAEADAAGLGQVEVRRTGALGRPFLTFREAGDGFRVRCARAFVRLNAERGQARGSPLSLADRARIRGRIATELFFETYGRAPADRRELSGLLARASRPKTTAVAGYDLTFSPVKSVSALWALAPPDVAARIERAHRDAVTDTLRWVEQHAGYTRSGAGGIRQVETTGLIVALFTHRDSRAGDPDLHTHAAVSNKVQARDGRWLALDGRVLYKATVAASERYNTMLEARLRESLGLRFTPRPSAQPEKRPVREIAGVDSRLLAAWSRRRRAILTRSAELAEDFQREHDRPPLPIERLGLAQQATLETREAKHAARSLREQRHHWRREAEAVLGGATALSVMLDRALHPGPATHRSPDEEWVRAAAARVIDTVSGQRAVWGRWHVEAEAQRVIRAAELAPAGVAAAVGRVVAEACSPRLSVAIQPGDPVCEPPVLRRSDASSMYTVAGAQPYTSGPVLQAESSLLAHAARGGGPRLPEAQLRRAVAEAEDAGLRLNPAQEHLVHGLAGSGDVLQLALAPAGSGKTTALRVLAAAWVASGGDVVGLAPTAVAAATLRDQLGGVCDTLAKLAWSIRPDRPAEERLPEWVEGIGPRSLLVVDEAGMAGTVELARVVAFAAAHGAAIRLIGDDQQLAAVAAGGVLRDIATQHGAITLTELIRFHDPAEAAATVAIRAGDTRALGFYLDRGRVHVGDLSGACRAAYAAWARDRADGLDALLVAPTRELVAALNARARADRLVADVPPERELALSDGNAASAGDLLVTRRNDRRLRLSPTDWVKNGDRWTVRAVLADGGLRVAHLSTGRLVTLPADYARHHAELGYASTVYGAQGSTADTCHSVLTGTETRQLLYVALTRGRRANHLHVTVTPALDEHDATAPEVSHPRSATEILTMVLARDGAAESATTTARSLEDPRTALNRAVAIYADALGVAAEHLYGAAALDRLDAAADDLHPALRDGDAWSTLRGRLALLGLDGHDPVAALRAAAANRELGSADDPAAVVQWRLLLRWPSAGGPLPWLPPAPVALRTHPEWGPYFAARGAQVGNFAALVAAHARASDASGTPAWAADLQGSPRERLRCALAVWRAAVGIDDGDPRPAGARRTGVAERLYQRSLESALDAAGVVGAQACWLRLADALDPRIRDDAHWPALASRLQAMDRAGLDAAGMLAAVTAERPLPDDLPAAALWWRLSPHLTPPVVTAADGRPPAPAWMDTLAEQFGVKTAEALRRTPAWPALVAAVSAAAGSGWSPAELLLAVTDGPGDGDGLTADALTEGLVFRITALNDPAPAGVDDRLPPDLEPPEDHAQVRWPEAATDIWTHAPAPIPPATDDGPNEDPPAGTTPLDGWPVLVREPDPADYLLEAHFWATAAVGRDRLVELNARAADFFTAHYSDCWAASYLRNRLGSELRDHPTFRLGWAPDGWRDLTGHLLAAGASEDELLAAGLALRSRSGRLIDRFRNRLMFPIHGADGAVHGFIGRRDPAESADESSGPKYTNTPTTDLFHKRNQLFGVVESHDLLSGGATPVLVEGPMDALAVTLAGGGDFAGVAVLGTSLTDRQAEQLRPHLRDGGDIIVATDADDAGHAAAERAYWPLAARGATPRQLQLPAGLDPAELLRREGAPALRHALAAAPSLAGELLTRLIQRSATGVHDGGEIPLRAAAEIIGALPPQEWPRHIDLVGPAAGLEPGILQLAVLDAGRNWTLHPGAHAAAADPAARAASVAPAVAADLPLGTEEPDPLLAGPGMGAPGPAVE